MVLRYQLTLAVAIDGRSCQNEKRLRSNSFDQKFGRDFLSGIPTCPGVYFVYASEDKLVYIGKAKNLRRRLGQYKNAKRRKKHAKMRAIVADAEKISFQTTSTDLQACILETRLIQEHRPKWNIAGAFFFLYPMIGMRISKDAARFCYTTQPELFPEFQFHGSYRSRHLTKEAFFALMDLLNYVGHRIKKPSRQHGTSRHSYIVGFRQIPESWDRDWTAFWKGDSKLATENLVLSLVENAGARHCPEEIQEKLNALKRFWRHEALPLKRAILSSGYPAYPIPQKERDIVFLLSRKRSDVDIVPARSKAPTLL